MLTFDLTIYATKVKTFILLLFQRRHSEKDYEIIPERSPWYFRWGPQGILTVLNYLKLKKTLEKETADDSILVTAIQEKFQARRFSCLYGRCGNARLRALVEEAQNRGIATNDELRSVVRYGDIRAIKNNDIRIHIPIFSTVISCVCLLICTAYFLLILLLLILSPLGPDSKLLLIGLSAIPFFGFSLSIYNCSIHPFLIIRRIHSTLQHLDTQLTILTSPIKLYAVK